MSRSNDSPSENIVARGCGHVELRDVAATAMGLLRDVAEVRPMSVRTETLPAFTAIPLGRTSITHMQLGPFEAILPDTRRTTGHGWLNVLMPSSGSTRYENEDHDGIGKPGQIIIFDSNKDTAISSNGESEHIVLSIQKSALPTPVLLRLDGIAHIVDPAPGLPGIFYQFLRATSGEARALGTADRIRIDRAVLYAVSDFLESCVEPLRTRGGSALARTRVAALHMIETDIDRLTSTADLAARLNCSERHLFLAFREAGMSPGRHIQMTRLKRAKAAIEASPDLSITEIAYSSGFQSYAHFSRVFKQVYGLSPRSLRATRG